MHNKIKNYSIQIYKAADTFWKRYKIKLEDLARHRLVTDIIVISEMKECILQNFSSIVKIGGLNNPIGKCKAATLAQGKIKGKEC